MKITPHLVYVRSRSEWAFTRTSHHSYTFTKEQFASGVQRKYVKAQKEHIENRLPSTELLDAFYIFDPAQQKEDNTSRLQVLIQQYCLNDPPFIKEDELKSECELFRVLLSPTHSSWLHY